MDATLADFIRILRSAGVRISVSETIDAYQALREVGVTHRPVLKNALGMTLAKTGEEQELFEGCFERFFAFQELNDASDPEESAREPEHGESDSGEGQGSGGGAGGGQQQDGELGELSRQLLQQDWTQLNADIAAAGQRVESNRIVSFVQRGRFSRAMAEDLGIRELDEDIARLDAGDQAARDLASRLERHRGAWLERIRDYVERQIALFADPEDQRMMRERLPQIKLSHVDRRRYAEMQDLVRRMARRLVTLHSRRRKTARRGQLDFRRTLRSGLAYDGIPFEPRWRRIKKDQPRIMALCDVSGSVAAVSRFLLMFLYSVSDVLPKVRSFAFSDSLGEVTELFRTLSLEEAVATTQQLHGDRSSSYGRSMNDFEDLCLRDIDHRTTVLVLGDARSNYGDPGISSLRKVHQRARQVIWLNPEPRVQWGYGDSEMPLLATACHRVQVCNTLKHLERLVQDLMRSAA
ncbi:MAG: VWA domain-containing protein [Ectothiorhodospiraceae bacterium]|nr:VWA domain-containing protein [Ectothiorhodospiraceae bacterium]MCH8505917.1 VWA domain-containing protein [Ectothiorhodospiraceae bacterium]